MELERWRNTNEHIANLAQRTEMISFNFPEELAAPSEILTKVNKKHGLLFHVRMTNDLPLCFVCGWLDDQGP